MGRNKKYKDSSTATSEAQKAAARAYYKRQKNAGQLSRKVLSITMSQDEYNIGREALTSHGLTPLQFWRWAIERLNAEPLPNDKDVNSKD